MNRVILLDVDGVLVHPGGYRAALRSTVQRLVGDFKIEEDLLADLEKRGISSEWDMSPLIVAAYWDDVLVRQPMKNLSNDVAIAANQIQFQRSVNVPQQLSVPEFGLVTGQYPAETAFQAGYYSRIPEALRKNLLTESRNVHRSVTFRTFQHFTLGSKNYEATYRLPAEFDAESFLLTEDKSNLSVEIRERLKRSGNHLAAFTARPSGLPNGADGVSHGYAPEAELALKLVGMEDIPLMAFGKLEYIARQHGLEPAVLVKPSPFQALAATFAAWTGDELSALQATYEWHRSNELNARFGVLPDSFDLIVIEDTMGGIFSTLSAGQILNDAGFKVRIFPIGLTCGSKSKAENFEKNRVIHFEDWKLLIDYLENPNLSTHHSV